MVQEKLWILMFGSSSEPRDSQVLRPCGCQLDKSPSQFKFVMGRRGNALLWPRWASFGRGLMTAQCLLQHWHFGHCSSLMCFSPPASQPMALLTAELWGIQVHLGFCHALQVRPTWGNKNHLSLCAETAAAGKPLKKKTLALNASCVCFILFYFCTISAVDFINFLQHCWEI